MGATSTTASAPSELRSKGRPTAGLEIRRNIYAAKRALRERGVQTTCPAANLISCETLDGAVVRCGIERSLITERKDPSSLLSFCTGDYQACGTWRAERERMWAGKAPLVAESEGE